MKRFISVMLCVFALGCSPSDETGDRVGPGLDGGEMTQERGLRVETNLGPVIGTDENGLRVFRGMPYAQAPVGDLRFRPPVGHAGWDEDFVADSHSAACPQQLDNAIAPPEPNQSEDCLSINVWAHKDAELKPVLVWVHGGGFLVGNGGRSMYDSAKLANRGDVVVVTFNYRLGMLGFLALDAFRSENEAGATGNYAILDQRLAFEWVRDNIEAFGGDPNQVTIFGQSAGAISVCTHLGMPGSDGLYHGAIIQSGTGCWGPWLPSQVEDDSRAYLEATECAESDDVPACLRALSVDTLLEAQRLPAKNILGQANIGPYVDGVNLPAQPLQRLAAGAVPRVPMIIGSTALEVAAFTLLRLVPAATPEDYDALRGLLSLSDEDQARLKEVFPLEGYANVKELIDELGTDFYFSCPNLLMARVGTRAGYSMRQYEFGYTPGGVLGVFGALHSTDEFYIFGNESESGGFSTELDEQGIAYLQDAWTQFARNGALDMAMNWPEFTDDNPSIRAIEPDGELIDNFRGGRCELLFEAGLLPQRAAQVDLMP